MPTPVHVRGARALEVEEDVGHERLEWRLQRWSWRSVALLLAAYLVLCDRGPLSKASARGDAFTVGFERVLRAGARSDVRVLLHGAPGSEVRLDLAGEAFEAGSGPSRLDVVQVLPRPAEEARLQEGWELLFRMPDARALSVTIAVRASRAGRARWSLRSSGSEVSIAQAVLP
jgi:hypothetical protein